MCLYVVLFGRLGRHGAGFVGMLYEVPAAVEHEFVSIWLYLVAFGISSTSNVLRSISIFERKHWPHRPARISDFWVRRIFKSARAEASYFFNSVVVEASFSLKFVVAASASNCLSSELAKSPRSQTLSRMSSPTTTLSAPAPPS